MIYAVIKTGGKQEKVVPGQRLKVDRIKDAGDTVSFTPLLVVRDGGDVVVGDDLGSYPVEAKVIGDERGVKIHGFKYKSKSGYRRRWGHRQELTVLEVTKIGDIAATEEKPAEELKPEPTGAPKKSAPKAMKADAKKTEAKKPEAKAADAKKTEDKEAAPRGKKADAKKSEAKKPSPKSKKKAEDKGEE